MGLLLQSLVLKEFSCQHSKWKLGFHGMQSWQQIEDNFWWIFKIKSTSMHRIVVLTVNDECDIRERERSPSCIAGRLVELVPSDVGIVPPREESGLQWLERLVEEAIVRRSHTRG